jgi:CubicO group peptidase (beta-lactamase class C family)
VSSISPIFIQFELLIILLDFESLVMRESPNGWRSSPSQDRDQVPSPARLIKWSVLVKWNGEVKMRYFKDTGINNRTKQLLHLIIIFGIISLVIVPPQPVLGAGPEIDSGQSERLKQVDHYLDEAIRELGVPGGAVALVHQGEQVYTRAWGVTGEQEKKVTDETPFLIGSLSKAMTAYGIMRLVDEGKIHLDAYVQQYLPWFTLADAEAASQITIRQLLTQTSGMSERSGLIIADQGASDQLAVQRNVKALATEPLEAKPGTRHIYSNSNYAVLGAVIEQVSGMTYAKFMESYIFSPLGMEHTAATVQKAESKGWEQGYRSWFGLSVPSRLPYDNGGAPYGYVASSASDMAKFLIAMQNPGKVVSAKSTNAMMQPTVSVRATNSYGYGWRIGETDNGQRRVWHAGSTPDFRSEMALLPESDWGIVLLTNQNNTLEEARLSSIVNGIQEILLGGEAEPVSFPIVMERWVTLGVVAILLAITIWLLTSFRCGMEARLCKWVWWTVGGMFFLLAAMIIPVLLDTLQINWHTFSLFTPDMKEMVMIMVILCAMNGVLSLIKASIAPRPREKKLTP